RRPAAFPVADEVVERLEGLFGGWLVVIRGGNASEGKEATHQPDDEATDHPALLNVFRGKPKAPACCAGAFGLPRNEHYGHSSRYSVPLAFAVARCLPSGAYARLFTGAFRPHRRSSLPVAASHSLTT